MLHSIWMPNWLWLIPIKRENLFGRILVSDKECYTYIILMTLYMVIIDEFSTALL